MSKIQDMDSFMLTDDSFGCQTDVYEKGKSLGKLTEDPRVIWIAEKHDKAVTQVVLGKLISTRSEV